MMQKVPVKILREGAALPTYGTANSAGADLRACLDAPVVLAPGETRLIPIGIAMEIPEGYEVQIRARSGLAIKRGIGLVNGIGTIDSDYRGEVKIALINWGDEPFVISNGERVAQMVAARYEKVKFTVADELSETERGSGGFGHTGV